MNASKESKLSMYVAVQVVLDDNRPVWQAVPAISTAVSSFKSRITNINKLEQARHLSSKGVTADKQAAREVMTELTVETAAAVVAYASGIHSGELKAKVALKEGDLKRARDTEVAGICRSVLDLARSNLAALGDYGINGEKLTALQNSIAEYDESVGKPRSVRSNTFAAGQSLDTEFDEADRVLTDQLDNLMMAFRKSQPGFHSAYTAARSVINSPGGHKARSGVIIKDNQPQAQSQQA